MRTMKKEVTEKHKSRQLIQLLLTLSKMPILKQSPPLFRTDIKNSYLTLKPEILKLCFLDKGLHFGLVFFCCCNT